MQRVSRGVRDNYVFTEEGRFGPRLVGTLGETSPAGGRKEKMEGIKEEEMQKRHIQADSRP